MAEYKTPGVYVEEISTFPPSVAGVATAIPAFIGFTAKCPKDSKGKPICQPIKVVGMVDYEAKFGGAPTLRIENNVLKNKEFVMYDSIRLFFDNGGKVCYVVSVGDYETDKTDIKADTYMGDKDIVFGNLEKVDEVTLLAFPDAAMLLSTASDLGAVHVKALSHCSEMGDRFAILDLKKEDTLDNTMSNFRDGVKMNNLKYGAAYYPYLRTTYSKEIGFDEMKNVDAINDLLSDGRVSPLAEKYISSIAYDEVLLEVKKSINEEKFLFGEIISFTPSSEGIKYENQEVEDDELLSANKIYQQIKSAKTEDGTWANAIAEVKSSYGFDSSINADYYSRCLGEVEKFSVEEDSGQVVVKLEGGVVKASGDGYVKSDDTSLTGESLAVAKRIFAQIGNTITAKEDQEEAKRLYAKAIIRQMDQVAANDGKPGYSDILAQYQAEAQVITPSAAIAGVYAMVDANKGVWQAPANVSLSGISNVTELISDREQNDMNVDANAGKSVNAIRNFSGKGIIVWGARTLDGNSNEWRYVSVRRLFNYIEESVQKSTNWAVFQPNDANTWVKVRCQIENFLSNLWRDGALAGSTPDKAFYVRVGLNETMTAQDILEGRMIVEIGLAAVRPAEFIILKFSHKMQEA